MYERFKNHMSHLQKINVVNRQQRSLWQENTVATSVIFWGYKPVRTVSRTFLLSSFLMSRIASSGSTALSSVVPMMLITLMTGILFLNFSSRTSFSPGNLVYFVVSSLAKVFY